MDEPKAGTTIGQQRRWHRSTVTALMELSPNKQSVADTPYTFTPVGRLHRGISTTDVIGIILQIHSRVHRNVTEDENNFAAQQPLTVLDYGMLPSHVHHQNLYIARINA